jgi:hypothetical protein
MWGPVLPTPFVAAAALHGALVRDGAWGWIALALLVLGILEGLGGLYLHLRGVAAQIGGISVRNVLSGPPPLLPLAYSAIGVFGVVALVWNASRPPGPLRLRRERLRHLGRRAASQTIMALATRLAEHLESGRSRAAAEARRTLRAT